MSVQLEALDILGDLLSKFGGKHPKPKLETQAVIESVLILLSYTES